ncbi:MAG TPA: hypothetical protein VGU02_00215 [Gaiellaceae bacterium]|nr:hypothetical protein [Gaiellaceae bacterium]
MTHALGSRIVIVGTYGAGKSTLAARLGAHLGFPVHHLDASRWQAGWALKPRGDWLRELDAHLAEPAWIVDGNFEATLDRRLAACDTVIFLDFPVLASAWRVVRRRLSRASRPDLPDGLVERPNLRLVRLLLDYHRSGRPTIAALVSAHRPGTKVIVLRGRDEVDELTRSVAASAAQREPSESDSRRHA